MFINLKIKGKSSDQSIKEAIEYIKVKYLKQRGFATEIDFNFYKNETEEVFNLIYNYLIIEKSIINIQDFEVKSVVKEYNFKNYNFKIENNFFVLFENEEPRFLILFKKNDKNKDKTTIQEVFPIIEDYLLKAFWGLDISLAKINEENRSFKNKSKIIRNIYIADLKNAKKFENIDFYEKTILNLINLYDEMIFKKNFIPIMEYELKDIQRFKEDNFINRLKDYWENRLFGKYEYESNDSYISIENYYNKVIFDKYINTDDFIKYKDKILLFFQLLLILSQEA